MAYQFADSAWSENPGVRMLGWIKGGHCLKYNYTNRISFSCYKYVARTWLLYNHTLSLCNNYRGSHPHPHTHPYFPLTHIHRDYTELLSSRTFQRSEFPLKLEYLVLTFYSNLGAYGHNLLAYERDVRGANLHPSANCAHELNLYISKYAFHINSPFSMGLTMLLRTQYVLMILVASCEYLFLNLRKQRHRTAAR